MVKEIEIGLLYFAREDGEIISKKYRIPRVMKQHKNKTTGYWCVRIGIGVNKFKTFNTHKLIAEALYGKLKDGVQVRHLDGDRDNNNFSNISFGTILENNADKIRHGTSGKGSHNAMAKLTEEDVLAIRAKYKKGVYGYMRIAKEYSVLSSTIQKIINREIWKHI